MEPGGTCHVLRVHGGLRCAHRVQPLHGWSRPRAHWPQLRGVNLTNLTKTIIPLALGRPWGRPGTAPSRPGAMTGGICCLAWRGRVQRQAEGVAPGLQRYPPASFSFLVWKFGEAFPGAAWDDRTTRRPDVKAERQAWDCFPERDIASSSLASTSTENGCNGLPGVRVSSCRKRIGGRAPMVRKRKHVVSCPCPTR